MLHESHWYWTQDPLTARKIVDTESYKQRDVDTVIKLLIRSKMLYSAMHELKKLLQAVIEEEKLTEYLNENCATVLVKTSRKIH